MRPSLALILMIEAVNRKSISFLRFDGDWPTIVLGGSVGFGVSSGFVVVRETRLNVYRRSGRICMHVISRLTPNQFPYFFVPMCACVLAFCFVFVLVCILSWLNNRVDFSRTQ